jgi:hypothetical protein
MESVEDEGTYGTTEGGDPVEWSNNEQRYYNERTWETVDDEGATEAGDPVDWSNDEGSYYNERTWETVDDADVESTDEIA